MAKAGLCASSLISRSIYSRSSLTDISCSLRAKSSSDKLTGITFVSLAWASRAYSRDDSI